MTTKEKGIDYTKWGIIVGVVALVILVYLNMFHDNTPKDSVIYEDPKIEELPDESLDTLSQTYEKISLLMPLIFLMCLLGFIIEVSRIDFE